MDETDRIKAPVAMPPLVRRIATMLIGLPGALLWLAGLLLGTTLSTVFLIVSGAPNRPEGWKFWAASVAGLWIGYSMSAAVSWFNGAHDYRMPGHRVPTYVAMEILDQMIATLSIALFFVMVTSLGSGTPPNPLLWVTGAILGFAALGLTMRMRRRRGNAWRDELLSGPEGAKPVY